jgi:exopolyphosphatase/guanosine-5'-triphosphate,3'-diphosphate pyrophosphatase
VGTNSVRLAIAHVGPDGSLTPLHDERETVRPGEGVFTDGVMSDAAVARLIAVLHRYRELGQEHRARLRTVATSAFRHASNADDVVRRVRWEVGLDLEIIAGREEARLVCLGALHDRRAAARSLVVDIGGGSTELVLAQGKAPVALWSLPLGCVRLTELATRAQCLHDQDALAFMRRLAGEALDEVPLDHAPRGMRVAIGASGTVRALVAHAADGALQAGRRQIEALPEALVALGPDGRSRRFEPRRADVILAGAVLLDELARRLRLTGVEVAAGGLREGLILDMAAREGLP